MYVKCNLELTTSAVIFQIQHPVKSFVLNKIPVEFFVQHVFIDISSTSYYILKCSTKYRNSFLSEPLFFLNIPTPYKLNFHSVLDQLLSAVKFQFLYILPGIYTIFSTNENRLSLNLFP